MDIKNIIKSFIKDNPDIDENVINMNIDEIIKDANDTNKHLRNKTINDINNELLNAVGNDEIYYNKLKGEYRLVDDIETLHIGKYIRWFFLLKENNEETLKLMNGGFVVSISPTKNNDGNHKILCKVINKFFSFIFEDTIVFQKLSLQEIMILTI